MKRSLTDSAGASEKRIDPVLFGSILGIISAALYTCSNICLKAAAHCDSFLVACMKAVPTVGVAIVMVALRLSRGKPLHLTPRLVLVLIGTGLIGQLLGNVGFQYALKYIGLALSVPLAFGTIIFGGTLLGKFWLGETITPRTYLAMFVLLLAVPILSLGAKRAEIAELPIPSNEVSVWLVVLGVTYALVSGLAYAWQGAVLRRMATSETPHSVTLLVISSTGVIVLSSICLSGPELDKMLATEPRDFANMLWAGAFNAVGFFALTKTLELIPVIHVNAINASQAAMAAVAGIAFFNEPLTPWLVTGVVLTVLGLLLIDRGKDAIAIDEV